MTANLKGVREAPTLCQCELSGEIHVLKDGKGCELCTGGDPFTADNVEKALRFCEARWQQVRREGMEQSEQDKAEERVDVYKGKYTVILRSDGTSTALRHGEEWPAYSGETQLDNLTCALARDLIEARGGEAEARLKGIHEAFNCCRQIVRSYGPSDLTQQVREALCQMMDHYEGTAGAIMPPVKRE